MSDRACSPKDVFFCWDSETYKLLGEMVEYINGVAVQTEPHKHFEPILIDLMVYREEFEKLNTKKRILFLEALKAEYIGSGWRNVDAAMKIWPEEGRFFFGIKLSA